MLKYIFAAVFIALAWAVVLVFGDHVPLWTAIVATAVIVLFLAGLALFRALKTRRAASALEGALDDQAKAQSGQARPDQQAEIAAMQAEFQKAVSALKASKLGRQGRDALGVLPWYVIIGPPGAGKTTALRNSGLKFPYAGKGSVRGVGGTRNCDWWLTNEAILLDTAGRWSTEDDDRDEWLSFLDLLKRTRPKKPVNGILVAVSVNELQAELEEIEATGRKLRERVDEVMGRLEMVVPVYLLVTKCDLVPGFVETFGGLRDKDRGQIWGFTLPLMAETGERNQMFGERLDEVIQVLEEQALERLGQERGLEARPKIYEFPQQLASLRDSLTCLVENLFAENAYQDAPIMRGLYFTSGTQEGRPIDRLMAKMAEAFGVRPPVVATAASPTKPKSYFVRDMFLRVVIPDKDVAMRSTKVLRKERIIRIGMTAGALALSAAFLFLPISSYLENRKFVGEAREFVEKLGRARATREAGTAPVPVATLESVEAMATRLASFETSGPDVSMRFGLYLGDKLMNPLETAALRLILRPIVLADEQGMTAFLRGRGGPDADSMLGALTLHLLLTQPKAEDEPAPEKEDAWEKTWVPRMVELAGARWASYAGEAASSKARRAVESAATFYVHRVEETQELMDRRTTAVSGVRRLLAGSSDGDPIAELVRDPAMPRPVRVVDVAGSAFLLFKGADTPDKGPTVPGAFTPDGWKVASKRLLLLADDSNTDEDAWILGERRKRKDVDVEALQTAYFRRYADAWKGFLLELVLKEPTNIDEARSQYKALLGDKPLDALWRNFAKFLTIKDDSITDRLAAQGIKNLKTKYGVDAKLKKHLGDPPPEPPKGNERPRRPGPDDPWGPEALRAEFFEFLRFGTEGQSGLNRYGQILGEVQSAVGDSGTPEAKPFQAALAKGRRDFGDVIRGYQIDGNWERGTLDRMLSPPLRGVEVAVVGATGESANRKWCETIVVQFDQQLADKYPFKTGKTVRDARVADVQKFFQPEAGTLWQYFNEALKNDVEHPAGTTLFRLKDGAAINYSGKLLTFLKRAQEITDFLFAKDPGKISVPYAVRIRPSPPYAKIVFESGGRRLIYLNARERWEEMMWPGNGAVFRALEKVGEVEAGVPDREWALFHLIDIGKIDKKSDNEDYLAGSWPVPVGSGKINADLKPAALLRPFRNFEVPRAIVSGARGCN